MVHNKACVLVVEDDPRILRLEQMVLEKEGYTVLTAGSGEEALDTLAEISPSLVVLDIGLPGMDGFTTCYRIREFSQVSIIMVTGRDCLEDKVRGMDVGADDYVTKPFLTHELATRVKVVLRRTSATAQEEADNEYLARIAQGLPEVTNPAVQEPASPPVQAQQPTASSEPAPTELAKVETVPEEPPNGEPPIGEPPIGEPPIENEPSDEPSDEPPIKEPIRTVPS